MGKHLSRLAAPKSWSVERKKNKWIMRIRPGPHGLNDGIPLGVVLREILRFGKTRKEINFILNQGAVLIDKIVRRDRRFPVGFMDVLEFASLNEYYRVLYDKKGRLILIKIGKEDSNVKICKIIGKTTLRGKKNQLNLYDGRNILVNKDYKVGDSVVFDIEKKLIKDHLRFEKGAFVYLTGGKHIGFVGRLKEIVKGKGLQRPRVIVDVSGKEFETLKDYAFVVGKDKAVISLGEK